MFPLPSIFSAARTTKNRENYPNKIFMNKQLAEMMRLPLYKYFWHRPTKQRQRILSDSITELCVISANVLNMMIMRKILAVDQKGLKISVFLKRDYSSYLPFKARQEMLPLSTIFPSSDLTPSPLHISFVHL